MDEPNLNWFQEYLRPELLQMVAVRETIYSGSTRFQQIQVLDTYAFGRCLILDGKTQSSETDEFIYHEALVHPALVAHSNPETVFIAGGGEGATLREVLAHNTVKRAVMVDLDSEVVEICRRFLPNHHQGAFDDSRTELHFRDAKHYLETTPDTYDVIIIDLPDPQEGGPVPFLYTQSFYRTLRQRLNPEGIVAVQSEPCMEGNLEAFTAISNTLKSVFPRVFPYHTMIPSFSFDWGFNLASLGPSPLEMAANVVDNRLEERGCKSLRSYDGTAHSGLFTLPKHVREALGRETRIITEDDPLVVV
ncbi:polyamine aminopropyltransferase [SAR202 cluster bacterium AC-647-N09_OGT_505m]|nr:polyamine aminopropyltransferase [SAR202 cluster bacterium AC-647-N09_OGT_505m]